MAGELRKGTRVWIVSPDAVTVTDRKGPDSDQDEVKLYAAEKQRGELPPEYRQYRAVFSESEASLLPDHGPMDHAIETTAMPPYGPIYKLSADELAELR